jgi:rhodanese-related sulfurtransferase
MVRIKAAGCAIGVERALRSRSSGGCCAERGAKVSIRAAKELVTEANSAVRRVSVDEAKAIQDRGEALFVDVREPAEWEKGRVPGALHVPRGTLEWAADPSAPSHKSDLREERPIVVYCASGGRSALAAKTLKDMGFKDVAHLDGGFTAWQTSGAKVET